MPICKREGFEDALSNNKNDTFHDSEEVFFCEITSRIFRDYEEYFRHVMAINSTVWQCQATGRENLTYAEAVRSERRARKKLELFKETLRAPVLLVVDQAMQSSLKALTAIVCKFLRKRFFLNEEVTACYISSVYNSYVVVDIIPPSGIANSKVVYEETEKLLYKLRRVGNAATVITVPFENIRRQRFEFTTENLQMFIKNNVTRVGGILRPNPESYKKYVTDQKVSFSTLFIGKMPHFTPAKVKRIPDESEKKQSNIKKYLVNNGDDKKEPTKREKEKKEKKELMAEEKAKTLKEEMERIRREKQERNAEIERQKIERKTKLLEKVEAECTAFLTKTDDLERNDQRLLPMYTTINTYIPTKLLGDAFMIREFIHSFADILSGMEAFRYNLSFNEMSRAFTVREVAGPLSDMLLVLLGTIFDMQKEEEEECSIEYLLLRKEKRDREPFASMSQATRAHIYAKRHFSFKINELPIDSLSLSEALRLHLLCSGASVKERGEKWRITYRNGYTSAEDPGLELRMRYPHILSALKMYTVYQLPFQDIVRILRCLVAQILTYSNTISKVEERMEQMVDARIELRSQSIVENCRISTVQSQKRALANECNQQCLKADIKGNEEKTSEVKEKFNKRIEELDAESKRERKKYEQETQQLHSALFNFMVFLGMDRAYRRYYVLESMSGIFVEHPAECLDTCLSNPPVNSAEAFKIKVADLPKNRKDLRAYLLKMYTEEEKEKNAAAKRADAQNKTNSMSQENKENRASPIVNGGLHNGHINGLEPLDTQASGTSEQSVVQPTQYQLYMCTGEPQNCIVHDDRNRDRQRWAYLYDRDDIDALIDSLNPLGERESQLRDNLTIMRPLIFQHVKKCPTSMLSIPSNQMSKSTCILLRDTFRHYSRSNFGHPLETDINEVMQSVLSSRILQLESDIYTGDLGRLKVKDMVKWRSDIQNNTYDPQGVLHWGPTAQKLSSSTTTTATAATEDDDVPDDDDTEILDTEMKSEGQYANKPYRDPGEGLGETMEIDSEESADEETISLHDSPTLRNSTKNLASALLQVEQAIERRFLKDPFGVAMKDVKDKELIDRKMKLCGDRLKQWEISLMESTSYSQVFLHLSVLHDSILWARSTNKSMCQVCRRGCDPDKMLLCDECNGGTHMFCMKPKMKTVPEGNWYCMRCVKRLGLENNEEKRKQISRSRRNRIPSDSETSLSDSKVFERHGSNNNHQRVQSTEIEEMLAENDSDNENDVVVKTEYMLQNGQQSVLAEDDVEDETEKTSIDDDDDESVCIVCSYEGSDLYCVQCKDAFHLECVNLKRPPRYNFVCAECKSKSDRKSKVKGNDKNRLENSSDDDDDAEMSEPLIKRSRNSRTSLRNSLPNDDNAKVKTSSSSRRSQRRTGENLPLNSPALYDLLEDIMKHEQSWPFLRPVSQAEVPDYYNIIKNPMDLAKVKSKLNMGAYQMNEEVMNDIQLIFNNCDQYNVKDNEIYRAGSSLEKYVIKRCKELNLKFKPSDMNE